MVFLLLIPVYIFLAAEADWLFPDSRIIGLDIEGDTRVYPLAILNWHGIVNETIGRFLVSILFYPLCGTVMAFSCGF